MSTSEAFTASVALVRALVGMSQFMVSEPFFNHETSPTNGAVVRTKAGMPHVMVSQQCGVDKRFVASITFVLLCCWDATSFISMIVAVMFHELPHVGESHNTIGIADTKATSEHATRTGYNSSI